MRTYRLFQWKEDDLEQMGQYEDDAGDVAIGKEIQLEWETEGEEQKCTVKILEILEPNPRNITRADGTIYEPDPIAIVEQV